LRKLLVLLFFVLACTQASAKIIIVGSYGGYDTYANLDPRTSGQMIYPLPSSKDSAWYGKFENKDEKEGNPNFAHGVRAAILYASEGVSEEVVARIVRDEYSVSEMSEFIRAQYKPGDKVVLIGYSSGAKYVIRLGWELNSRTDKIIPIRYMALIDGWVDVIVHISPNVIDVSNHYQISNTNPIKRGKDEYVLWGKTDYM